MKKSAYVLVSILIMPLSASFGLVTNAGQIKWNAYRNGPVAEAVAVVSKALQNQNPRIRANAIEVVSDGKIVFLMPKVIKLLKDESMPVRFAAATAIGDMQYLSAKQEVMAMLNDKNENVTAAAAYALVKLGENQYAKAVAEKTASENQTVRANAAMLLGKIGNKNALKILYRVKDDKNSSDVAAFSATEAIAKLGDNKIYGKIWTMLISAYADDRYMGTIAMSHLKTDQAAGALITMLDDEIPEVRITAAGRLGLYGDQSGAVIVDEYLSGKRGNDADETVKEHRDVLAAIAVGQIGQTALVNYLPKMLKENSVRVRLAAAKSILLIESKIPPKRP